MQGVRTSRRAAVNGRRWAEQPAQEKGSREAAHHLYRWLPEAEEHSGPRGLWQSRILRRGQLSPALGVPHVFKRVQKVRSYSRS